MPSQPDNMESAELQEEFAARFENLTAGSRKLRVDGKKNAEEHQDRIRAAMGVLLAHETKHNEALVRLETKVEETEDYLEWRESGATPD